jgi:hypothetical protein
VKNAPLFASRASRRTVIGMPWRILSTFIANRRHEPADEREAHENPGNGERNLLFAFVVFVGAKMSDNVSVNGNLRFPTGFDGRRESGPQKCDSPATHGRYIIYQRKKASPRAMTSGFSSGRYRHLHISSRERTPFTGVTLSRHTREETETKPRRGAARR